MYYNDDINMLYQASPEEAEKSLKELSQRISNSSSSFEEVSQALTKLGININDSTYDILKNISIMWNQVYGGVGNKELCNWTASRSGEEIDNSNLKSDLEIFDEKLENNEFLIFDSNNSNDCLKFD